MSGLGPTCTHCGAPLVGTRYVLRTKCRHCGTEQDNPAVLAVDDEVMKPRGEEYELGTVRACRGPKGIDVRFGGREEANLAFIDLVPVLRANDELKEGTLVFRNDLQGWVKTWTGSDAAHGAVKLKHGTAGFQDPFFDTSVSLVEVRVPAIAIAAGKRSRVQTYLARFKDDPFGSTIKLFIGGMLALMVGGLVLFVVAVVLSAACGHSD